MKTAFCHLLPGRRVLSAILLAHLLASLVLAASPKLHRWLHGDADADDHDCAVVLFAHGGADALPVPAEVPEFRVQTVHFAPLALDEGEFVPSIFILGNVFAHGPPLVG